ncbi:MAG: nitrate reductase molybdenum cofactor assembly chaperone [Desulfomonilaceae bacterium]
MPNQEDRRTIFKLFSVLLSYPDEDLLESSEELRLKLTSLSAFPTIAPCGDFLDFLDSTPLIVIQEQYSTVFDFNAQTCLNLTYHEHGESSERGTALANFRQLYKKEGYEQSNSELPDYLPVTLEFLSLCSDITCYAILERHIPHMDVLAERLKELGHPYHNVMEALSLTCRKFVAKGV